MLKYILIISLLLVGCVQKPNIIHLDQNCEIKCYNYNQKEEIIKELELLNIKNRTHILHMYIQNQYLKQLIIKDYKQLFNKEI